MKTKHFIAINLEDYHDRSKRWQGGAVNFVRVRVVGGKNLNQAKKCVAELYPNQAWYVFPMGTMRNMVYSGEWMRKEVTRANKES